MTCTIIIVTLFMSQWKFCRCLELEFETGESRKVPKHLSLYLHVLNNPKEVLAKFKFSILNDEGKEIKSWSK